LDLTMSHGREPLADPFLYRVEGRVRGPRNRGALRPLRHPGGAHGGERDAVAPGCSGIPRTVAAPASANLVWVDTTRRQLRTRALRLGGRPAAAAAYAAAAAITKP